MDISLAQGAYVEAAYLLKGKGHGELSDVIYLLLCVDAGIQYRG